MMMMRKFITAFAMATLLIPFGAKAQFFYDEPGKNSTGVFQMMGDARYTATSSGSIDHEGDGWIRLTKNEKNQLGYVIMDRTFPSTMGVTIEFDFKIWGNYPGMNNADQADGFCVFLIDATNSSFTQGGAKGGGLGFTGDGTLSGSSPTYLGVGIDVKGNFSDDGNGKKHGAGGPRPQTIALRTGDIPNGIDYDYYYLNGLDGSISPQLSAYGANRPADATYYRRVRVNFDPTLNKGVKVTVFYKTLPSGVFEQKFTYNYTAGSTPAFIARPDVMRVGFSATTGGEASFHEVRNVLVRTPGQLQVIRQPVECPTLNTPINVETVLSCFASAQTITVIDTLPHGYEASGLPTITPASGTAAFAGTPSQLSNASDGRHRYTYTVNIEANSYAYVKYNGQFNSMPAGGQFSTSASLTTSIGGLSGLLDDDIVRYSSRSGVIKNLTAGTPAAGMVIYNPGTPKTFTVNAEAGSSLLWEYSTDGGANWQTGVNNQASYTPPVGLFDGRTFQLRCTANFGANCNAVLNYTCMVAPDNVSDMQCFTTPPSTPWTFREVAKTAVGVKDVSDGNQEKGIVSSYGIPLVGDIDNDGKVEIVAPAVGITGKTQWGNNDVFLVTDKLRILNFANGAFTLKQTITTPYYNIIGNCYAIAKVDGPTQPAAIFLCTSIRKKGGKDQVNSADERQQLIKYTLQNGSYTKVASKPYLKPSETGYGTKEMAQPMIADFDGDGNPEVLAYGRIFNAQTMEELARLDIFQAGYGSGSGAHTNNMFQGESSSIMAIADMDGDGLPEVVAGDCVYKVEINNKNGSSGNFFYRWKKCAQKDFSEAAHSEVKDGATSVADIDLDGQLDVIVTVPGSAKSDNSVTDYNGGVLDGAIYVWNPRTERVMHTNIINNLPTGSDLYAPANPGSGPSVAFVGDIDGDKKPDICFTARRSMYAYYFNANNKQLVQRWRVATNDQSGSTSMAVFDFNQDGKNELVYRDEKKLRILDHNGDDIQDVDFQSYTQNEYPVIADIDGDGHAEILITGNRLVTSWDSQLRVYSSNPAGMWAPARKVWNQFGYNVVNINEDLTVPKRQFNPATLFPNDLRPFNGYLQQQTPLNLQGEPLWPAGNAAHASTPSFSYNSKTDSLTITVKVTNTGSYPFYPPFKISVHKDNAPSSSLHKTYSFSDIINPGDVFTYKIGISKFKAQWAPFSNIVIRLNDSGNGLSDQAVCDVQLRDEPTGSMIAIDDYSVVGVNSTASRIPVSINDIKSCVGSGTFTVQALDGGASKQGGTFIIAEDSTVFYTPPQDFRGYDTLRYSITCNAETDIATVFITVTTMPDNLSDADCYTQPPPTDWGIKQASVSTAGNVAANVLPLVGDLTGDGIPEIVCWSRENAYDLDGGTGLSRVRTILVYNGSNIKEPVKKFNLSSNVTDAGIYMSAYEATPFGLVQTHDGKRLIVVACSDLYLRAYDIVNGAPGSNYLVWTSNDKYGSVTNDMAATVGFADFNQDGYPEIYIRNKVFDAESGKLLATASGGTNTASSYTQFTTASNRKLSAPVAADVIGDDKLELILGNEVYRVKIDHRNGTGGGNEIVRERTIAVPTNSVADGHPQVADFNGDGHLDILITVRHGAGSGDNVSMYVWDIYNGKVGPTFAWTNVDAVGKSIPLITDIDNDGKLEILIQVKTDGTNISFLLYECNPATLALTFDKWGYSPKEDSYSNSVTAFDFNHDGKLEILLTDQEVMKIFDGTLKPVNLPLVNTSHNSLATFNIKEVTVMQYPIIADVDDDGQAEIIIIGYETDKATNSKLRIYKSAHAASPWAPARKVWNQYMYNSVNINDDLTVPQYQFNPATKFAGEVQPYNNFLQQQTALLSRDGTPVWLLPAAQPVGSPSYVYSVTGDSLTVTLRVFNAGDASLAAPFMITAYQDGTTGSQQKRIYAYPHNIQAGETVTITFGIPNFKANWTPFTDIWIHLNDNGNGLENQKECGLAIRDIRTGSLIAVDDQALVFKNTNNNRIRVSANDFKLCTTPSSFTVQAVGSTTTPHGSFSIDDSVVVYTPAPDWIGGDTLKYRIQCNGEIDTATVYINIVEKPDNIVTASCFGKPAASVWSLKQLAESTQEVSTVSSIYAGDMDGDGHVEILALGLPSGSSGYGNARYLYLFDESLTVKYTIDLGAEMVNLLSNSISIADVNGDGKAEIFLCTTDGYLRKYSWDNGANNFTTMVSVQHTNSADYAYCQPMIADFNGDGVPEVVVLDKVYNAQTLTLLVDGTKKGTGNLGMGSGHVTTRQSGGNKQPSMMAIGDIDNDGLPEILAGATAYKVTIVTTNGMSNNKFEVYKQANASGRTEVGDGATAIADMDLDGYLDVIVSRRTSGNNAALFIWNPRTGAIMNTNAINNLLVYPASGNYGPYGPSVPFVGDIDGDGKPEVVIVSHNKGTTSQTDDAGRVSAYDFDNGTLTEKWRKITSDYSAATGITLFDFNQDGAGELVYRSITHLHVLNGVNGTDMMSPEVCSSPTGMEYPIVVDYNNDGSAEIIVTGGSATLTLDPLLAGKLRAYGSDGAAWAPARKVWNQYMYNAVNINEDLTVPRRMLNPATVFPGEDGLIGTIDDVRPYNSFLQQQTLLSVTGETLWKLPDYVVTGTPIAEYFTSGDSIIISNICVENNGDARGGDNIQIALYRDNRSPANLLKVYTLPAAIEVGSAPRCYKIKYVGASAITASSLYIEVNDDGAVHPQTECDYSGNSILMPFASMLIARNDYMTIFACGTNTIDILANDLNAFGATASIVSGGKYGSTSTVVLSYFTYDHALSDCADHAGKRDTAVYKISNGTVSSSAYIFIDILHAPDIVLVDSCSLHPYLAVTHEYLGATYRWYRSTNGVNGWSEIPGQTESRLYVTDNDYYRVEVTFKGAVGESSALRFIVVKKRKLSGNIIWYESKSEKQ